MPISKKTINYGASYDKNILNNKDLALIGYHNDIINIAHKKAQDIINQANIEANQIIEDANNELATIQQHGIDLLQQVQYKNNGDIEDTQSTINKMLSDAKGSVHEILTNSEQIASKEVWDKACDLINSLEITQEQFYINADKIIKSLLASMIKKLTSNIDIQNKMHILASQVFEKAKEVEHATLFFSTNDFEHLPNLHIPQTWKIEKDLMLDDGWCKLVGAGGEWKTSIYLIERKMLEAINYNIEQEIDDLTTTIDDEVSLFDDHEDIEDNKEK
jgi:vacuolar-type H+-ATPase subunit H